LIRLLDTAAAQEWLANAPVYRSENVVQATRLDCNSTWTTAGGSRLTGQAGDWLVWDDRSTWSVAADLFSSTYEPLGGGRFRKSSTIRALRLSEPTEVETVEGFARAEAGDFVALGHAGDVWPIPYEHFHRNYIKVQDPT